MTGDPDLLPPEDRCAHRQLGECGLPRAAHVGWEHGGPSHDFLEPQGAPRPERVTSCHIQTTWACTHCGEDNDVWGAAAGEWMECSSCGRNSFLIPFLDEPRGEPDDRPHR